MVGGKGTWIGWTDVPEHVREAVAETPRRADSGARATGWRILTGSSGAAAVADGRRAFVKAGNLALDNVHTPGMYRREAQITAALPPQVPATAPIGCYDDGDWVALVLAGRRWPAPARSLGPPRAGRGPRDPRSARR